MGGHAISLPKVNMEVVCSDCSQEEILSSGEEGLFRWAEVEKQKQALVKQCHGSDTETGKGSD